MSHPDIHTALMRERQNTFLAQADTDRRARQARLARRAGTSRASGSPLSRVTSRLRPGRLLPGRLMPGRPRWATKGNQVVLRDGSQVLIRPVQGTDAPLLTDGFARLSARSRQMRFMTGKPQLSPAELRYFTEVDHHDHEAIGALNRIDGRGVGIARYIRSAEDPQAAEIAVTVVDEWHRRGLGTELLAQLSDRARQAGIRRFTAMVAAENRAVAELLQRMGGELVRRESTTLEYEIVLVPEPARDRVRAAAAAGQGVRADALARTQPALSSAWDDVAAIRW
jgi:RimJ/RimL family protein N-acetyltransferase